MQVISLFKSQLLPESGDEGWWGDSLEVSGDLLFIGAPNAALNAGKVLLYQRINGIYTKQAELSDPRTGITEFFGSSISFGANQEKLIISPNVEEVIGPVWRYLIWMRWGT